MTDLSFTTGDQTWHDLRDRALSNLYFFAGVICDYGDKVGMTEGMHKLMCRVVERKTGIPQVDTCPYRLVLMPRGTGKSTLITQAYVLQRICRDPNIAVLIANEKLENAQAFLSAIKWQLEQNELLRRLFPELIHEDLSKAKWNESEINVPRTTGRKEPTIKCQGAGAALASMHVDLAIVDDEISREAAENARRGDGQITNAMKRWNAQLPPLLNPGYQPFSEIVWIGTRWFRGDPYELLEEQFGNAEPARQTWTIGTKLPNGDIQSAEVHRRGDLVIFTRQAVENGRAVWPERPGFSIEDLAKVRLRDPELYAANYMNAPSDEVTATFKESWLQYYDWVNDGQVQYVNANAVTRSPLLADLDVHILVDPGGFKRGNSKGGDRARAAIVVTGTTTGDTPEHLILDCYSERVPYQVAAQKILEFARRYRPRRVHIEVEAQQIVFMDVVKKMAAEAKLELAFEELHTKNVNKEARILELEPYFQRGILRVGKGPRFHEFFQQFRSWPAPRCDLLDVLAYGPRVWRKGVVAGTNHAQRQQQERQAYLQRRGMTLSR